MWVTEGPYKGRVVAIARLDEEMVDVWLGPKKRAWVKKSILKPIEQHGKREFKQGRSYV